ncbi:unnamed protein product [Rhizophagus irregularis]|nr:unnamed protein product [Rhizophagus irregularis]
MEIYAPSKNENVSPRQNIFELIVDMRLSNLEPLKGESESLKQMFDLIDDENLPSNESPHNTFLPVGFQITKETLGYLDVENFNIHSSIIKRKRNGNEEIEEEEVTDDDANGNEEEKGVEEEGAEEECSGGGGTVSVVKQVDGTDGKSMGPILMTPSVQLGGPSQSVWFDFGSKLDHCKNYNRSTNC